MNRLIGAKVSITSRKAQTTRHRITGIQTTPEAQFIYVDTPGFQTRHSNALNKTLNKTVTNTLTSSDVILYIIEAGTFGAADQQVIDLIPDDIPCILVINKADRVKDKAMLMPFAQQIAAKHNFAAVVPVSAKLGFQLENLQDEIPQALLAWRIRPCLGRTTSLIAARNSWQPRLCGKNCFASSAMNCLIPARC